MVDLPSVSVVVVTWNGQKWLPVVIPSVLASDYPPDRLEIILVDNGSTDGSLEWVRATYGNEPRLSMVLNDRNMGWSPANNQGIFAAKGEIVVCLSNDMEVEPNWLRELVKVFASDPAIGVVQCNSLSMSDRQAHDSGANFLDRFGYGYGYIPPDYPVEVFYAEGMAFAVRRRVVEELGGLDDYYFMEYDDMDFCWKVRLGGYKVYHAPGAVVYHARGGTSGTSYVQRAPLNSTRYVRNHFATMIKNYEVKNLVTTIPVALGLEAAKISYLLAQRQFRLSGNVIQGMFWAVRDLGVILEKRRQIQRMRRVPDREILRAMAPFNPRLLAGRYRSSLFGFKWVLKGAVPPWERPSPQELP